MSAAPLIVHAMLLPSSSQAIRFLSDFVTIRRDREIATPGFRYFVPTSSSVEFEQEFGQWMHDQQLQRFAVAMGCPTRQA
jgi:hypothetical protein